MVECNESLNVNKETPIVHDLHGTDMMREMAADGIHKSQDEHRSKRVLEKYNQLRYEGHGRSSEEFLFCSPSNGSWILVSPFSFVHLIGSVALYVSVLSRKNPTL